MQGVLRVYTGRLTNQNQGTAPVTSADRIFTTVIWQKQPNTRPQHTLILSTETTQ